MSVNDRRQALDSRIEAFVFAVIQIGDQFLLEVSRTLIQVQIDLMR